ncbi:hypothetical protein KP509_23G037900 [Ceratopteris richardii]|nr:hypothetical protein KP509_23G037900 [Ceratopteris richardii]
MDCSFYQEALQLHVRMRDQGIEPDSYTCVSLLKACGVIRNLEIGRSLHALARRMNFMSDLHVVTTLVCMYGRCGVIRDAENLFCSFPLADVVLCNSLMSAYIECNQGAKALQFYKQMLTGDIPPDKETFIIALQACGMLATKESSNGLLSDQHLNKKFVLLEIVQSLNIDSKLYGLNCDISLTTAIVNVYGKCEACKEAEIVFSRMCRTAEVIPWTAMLSAYVDADETVKAFLFYRQMEKENVLPIKQTVLSVIKACARISDHKNIVLQESRTEVSLGLIKAIHIDAIRRGLVSDLIVSNALISTYGKLRAVKEAQNVFNDSPLHDVISWTSLLSVFVDMGYGCETLQLYVQMQKEGCYPNDYTFVVSFRACGLLLEESIGFPGKDEVHIESLALEIVRALHVDAEKLGLATNVFVASTLLTTYGKCGSILEAKLFFDSFPEHGIAISNAMLSAFVDHNQEGRALKLFVKLQNQKCGADVCTLLCALQACNLIGALETCWNIHSFIVSAELELEEVLISSLICAYGKNSRMIDAEAVANGSPQLNTVTWNGCVAGYVGEGRTIESLQMFEQLKEAVVEPNNILFTSLLSACSHGGLVEQGLLYYKDMGECYAIDSELQHYGSILDLLGRAGDFRRIKDLLHNIPITIDSNLGSFSLGACFNDVNSGIGKQMLPFLSDLQPDESIAQFFMPFFYSDWNHDIVAERDDLPGIT